MKSKVVFAVLMAALCSAYGATVRTATEGFVTNRIAQAAAAATNYTNAAIAALPAPDYSPTNAELRATIEAVAPAPGDYENISNRVMRTISLPGDEGHHPSIYTPIFKGRANLADGALALTKSGQISDPGSLRLRQRWYEDAYGAISGVMWPSFLDAEDTWHWVASEDYVDDLLAHFDPPIPIFDYYAEDVTNVVRGCSLGGIWDAELEVWWTPVMVGGSLTYQATTNVNLNAEH